MNAIISRSPIQCGAFALLASFFVTFAATTICAERTPHELKEQIERTVRIVTGGDRTQLSIKGGVTIAKSGLLEVRQGVNVEAIPADIELPAVSIIVDGALTLQGKEDDPIMMRGWFHPMILDVLSSGRVTAKNVVFRDMTIQSAGIIEFDGCILSNVNFRSLDARAGKIVLKNCVIENNTFDEAVVIERFGSGPEIEIVGCLFRNNEKGALRIDASKAIKSGRPKLTLRNCDFVNNKLFNLKVIDSKDIQLDVNHWGAAKPEDALVVVEPKNDRRARVSFDKGLAAAPVNKLDSIIRMSHRMLSRPPFDIAPNMLKNWADEKRKAAAGPGTATTPVDPLIPGLDDELRLN